MPLMDMAPPPAGFFESQQPPPVPVAPAPPMVPAHGGVGPLAMGPPPSVWDRGPAAPPPAPARVPVPFAAPPPQAAAGGAPGPSPGIAQAQEANAAYWNFTGEQLADLAARRKRGGGYVAPTKETEQRTGVTRQNSRGPDPEIEAERDFIVGDKGAPINRVAPAQRTYRPEEILALSDPPATAKTDKAKRAWAEAMARDLAAKDISLATADANRLLGPRSLSPKVTKGMSGEQLDAAEKADAEERQRLIAALDERHVVKVGQVSEANELAQAKSEQWARQFGAGGMQGNAAAMARSDARLSEAYLGKRETQKAEEGAGKMVRDEAGNWVFEQDQDKEVWTPGAIEQKQQAEAKFQEEKARLLEAQQARADKVLGDIDKMAADVQQGKIDPNGFYADKSTAAKIGLAIAQAVGTFASAYGVKNDANAIISDAIDRDVKAQVANLAEKRGKLNDMQQLYKRVLDDTGSKVAAADALRAAAFARVDMQLGEAAATATSEKAQAQVQDVQAKMRLRELDRRAEISERVRGTEATQSRVIPATKGGYVGTGAIDKEIEHLLQKRLGLGEGSAKLDLAVGNTQAEMAKARGKETPTITWQGQDIRVRPGVPEATVTKAFDAASSGQTLLGSLAELDAQQKKMGANTLSRKESEIMVRSIVGAQLNQLVGGGAMSNDEAASMINTLSDSMAGGDAAGARARVASFVTRRVNDQLRTIQAR